MEAHTQLITALLGCGTLDTAYFLRLLDAYDLSPFDLLDDVASYRGDARPTANDLIDVALNHIADCFIKSLPSRVRLNASTLDYQVFTNCLDSHLWFDDERIDAHFQEWRRH